MPGAAAGLAIALLLVAEPGCEHERSPPPAAWSPRPAAAPPGESAPAALVAGRPAYSEGAPPGDASNTGEKGPAQTPLPFAPPPLEKDSGKGVQAGEQRGEGPGREGSPLEDKSLRDYSRACLSEGCHARLRDTRRIHGPVAVNACQMCHASTGSPADHRFVLARPDTELCQFCHPPAEPLELRHEPFSKAECSKCHDPHGGNNRSFLAGATTGKTCEPCHERRSPLVPHPPVAEGDCLTCHTAHQSRHARLLRRPEKEVCLGCHADYWQRLSSAKIVHEPAMKQCSGCHMAHGGDYPKLLGDLPDNLCGRCHQPVVSAFANAASAHGQRENEKWCSGCHEHHAGDNRWLLVVPENKLCLGCHDREIESSRGRKVPNVQEQIASATSIHAPLAEGACTTCHQPHASQHKALLRAGYPSALYAEYSDAVYAACFACHDQRTIADERTTATGFRDGDRNLHFVHVKREKGRTCGVCHEPHASSNPKLMRDVFAFGPGGWMLPIQFVKTPQGGSCGSGCHKKYSYDNTHPPASVPPPASPPASPSGTPPGTPPSGTPPGAPR